VVSRHAVKEGPFGGWGTSAVGVGGGLVGRRGSGMCASVSATVDPTALLNRLC
jgi:hypothetical protein